MKKIILSAVLCGGILISSSTMLTAHADDTLSGSTAINSEVIKGDVTLTLDSSIDFGKKPLANIVDFGAHDINYTVTDYSGNTNGYTISAKLSDTDAKRSLKIADVELSDTDAQVISQSSNQVGDNTDKVSTTLQYTGVTETKTYTSSIEWTLTKATTRSIAE
ncbi:hypothetical protein ACI1TH_00380 [Lactococcus petauri]|uniref:hypothetical protein n=1 Tax=Lactococcus petauri TaxID=1940789 RepID=UPI003854AED9